MSGVRFESKADEVKISLDEKIRDTLDAVGEMGRKAVVDKSPVVTGRLKGSIDYISNPSDREVYVGTDVEYAPPVEFGRHGGKGGHHMIRDGLLGVRGDMERVAKHILEY